ncbi:hypothetical protein JW826_05985 [Candidatus Woesearchaeota archaeon]|nr:hypothetical protein [Candidatus Woesearchaeota archaeon]
MDKRGAYFFVIDAIIAGVVLVAGLMFIFSTYSVKPESDPTVRASEDFLLFISSTKIRDYYNPVISNMTLDGNITRIDNTILEQMMEFYYNGKQPQLEALALNVINNVVSPERSAVIVINSTIIHNKTVTPMERSKLLVSAKRMSFTRINETLIFGPVWIEVKIWV